MKPLNRVKLKWSNKFAYTIGLIATDGNLSKDGRHIIFTSKDMQLVELFIKALGIDIHVGKKARGGSSVKNYYTVQIGDVNFYNFLFSIGIKPRKSKTIGEIKVPVKYFFQFLRGCFDGDGSIVEFMHPQSKLPQLRVCFISASMEFLHWIRARVAKKMVFGYYGTSIRDVYRLVYAKRASIKLLELLYKNCEDYYLQRKYIKAEKYLRAWRNWQTQQS